MWNADLHTGIGPRNHRDQRCRRRAFKVCPRFRTIEFNDGTGPKSGLPEGCCCGEDALATAPHVAHSQGQSPILTHGLGVRARRKGLSDVSNRHRCVRRDPNVDISIRARSAYGYF